jgi:hypothetical protein
MMKQTNKVVLLSLILILIGFVYCGSYWILMLRDRPVFVGGKIRFLSSYLFAPIAPKAGDFDVGAREASVMNWLFLPADSVYYSLNPDSRLVQARQDPKLRVHFWP